MHSENSVYVCVCAILKKGISIVAGLQFRSISMNLYLEALPQNEESYYHDNAIILEMMMKGYHGNIM